MGFDGLFFGRLDYADKEKRLKEKTMEMVWKGRISFDILFSFKIRMRNTFRVKYLIGFINFQT